MDISILKNVVLWITGGCVIKDGVEVEDKKDRSYHCMLDFAPEWNDYDEGDVRNEPNIRVRVSMDIPEEIEDVEEAMRWGNAKILNQISDKMEEHLMKILKEDE